MRSLQKLLDAGLLQVAGYRSDGVEPAEGTMGLNNVVVNITHPSLDEPVALTLNGRIYGKIIALECTEKPVHDLTILDEGVAEQVLQQIRDSAEGRRIQARFDDYRLGERRGGLLEAAVIAFFADNRGTALSDTEIREGIRKLLDRPLQEVELKPEEKYVLEFGPCVVKVPVGA
jgi:hypothetical protein